MTNRRMKCPFCGSADTQVIDSRVSEPGDSIRRRRRCAACKKRFTTYETVELRLPQVVKTNGTRSDFDVDEAAHRFHARAAQAAGAHASSSTHAVDRIIAAGAGARRARDPVAPHRRDGDAGALQARQGRATSASRRSIDFQDVVDFQDAIKEVETPPRAAQDAHAALTHEPMRDADRALMARALALAERGLYTTTPNPRVGCVIVRGGAVVGEGWHERAGGAHAEVVALPTRGAAAHDARGATALRDARALQPHRAHAAVRRGVARAPASRASSRRCPTPIRAARQGAARLRAAGVASKSGLIEHEARELNRRLHFAHRRAGGRGCA